MKARIILHCGAPKTGSTSFQHLLYANRRLLLQKGFYCPAVSRKKRVKDDIRILLAELALPQNDNQAYLMHIGNVIEKVRAESGCHTLILSNESVLGKPFPGARAAFYEGVDERVERLRLALHDYDVDVRFVIRDYAAFLPSWYVQQVRMGSTQTFDEFVSRGNFEQMTWETPVNALRKHFNPERLGVYDHADMVADPIGFLRAMFPDVMAALGEKGRELPRKNASIGVGMVENYRRWNMISRRLSPTPAWRRKIHHLGRRYVLLPFERFSTSPRLVLPADLTARLKAKFKVDRDAIGPKRVRPASQSASG